MWKVIDKHHMTNGIYTISKNISSDARVVKPYGLHKGNAKSGYVTAEITGVPRFCGTSGLID